MATKSGGPAPINQRKHNETSKAEALRLASENRRDSGYDNARAESFRRRFKAELSDGGRFPG